MMTSRTWLLGLFAMVAIAISAQETKKVFIYSPNERGGLHIAQYADDGWREIGQLCSSDYGQWGAEKKMIHPSVARATDGTWRLVFQVNDRAPLFAAAYSRDLVTWRPQDYPVMTTAPCLKPVIFANDNGTFDIYYQTKAGDKRWTSASNDFRKFSKDEKSLIDEAAWTRDTATVAGKLQEGCLFEISSGELNTITTHFEKMREDGRLSSERMFEDAKNPQMPQQPVTATLTVKDEEKAISDKLIGIFFEDISYAADGGLYAELVQNRDFEYSSKDRREWSATTAWHSARPIEIATEHPLSPNNPHYALLWPQDTLWNEGWDGIVVEAGKKYDVFFNAAAWKDNGGWMKFQILTEAEEIVFETVVKTAPNVNGSTGAVNGAASFNTKFVPEATGNYKLRWIPATNENGDQGGFNEVLLANPRVRYVPNVAGIEETQLLATALENAKSTLAANSDDRYSGAAFDALNALIQKYEAEGPNYTAPSAYRNAAAALDEASQALKDHRVLCDTYDALPTKAQQIVDNNAEKKFANTQLYASLKAVAAKYVTKETSTVTDPETGETSEVVNYIVKVIKDDAELQAAIEELQYLVNTTDLLFTEGESKTSDTGVKVLVERLRLGAEALKSLGAGDDPLVAAANNALTDDDDLAEAIQNKLKVVLYEQLKDPNNQLFAEQVNEETLESYTPTYDMTVFVKNPNIYKQQDNMNFTEENVPGWYTPEGYNRPGLSVGWGQPRGNNEIAEDCMFQTWGSSFRVEQTVYNAPVGIYTLKVGFGERMNDDEANFEGSYIYAKTSDTLEGEDGQLGECPGIGQSFPYANAVIENIVVTDGIITFGANGGPSSHTFVNDVRLLISGMAPYVDYGQLYQDAFTDIDGNVIKPATVRAVELYDLNGRRLVTASKGVMIVRKYMSDGTIRVEKVVKK